MVRLITSIVLDATGQHPSGVVGLACGHYVTAAPEVMARLMTDSASESMDCARCEEAN